MIAEEHKEFTIAMLKNAIKSLEKDDFEDAIDYIRSGLGELTDNVK